MTQARQPFAGSALGLLKFDGKISPQMYDAGNRYAEAVAEYYGYSGLPFPSPKAQALFATGRGHPGDETATQAQAALAAKRRMEALDRAVLSCVDGYMARRKVFEVCVLNEIEARDWPPATISYLRRGLDALAFFYAGGA